MHFTPIISGTNDISIPVKKSEIVSQGCARGGQSSLRLTRLINNDTIDWNHTKKMR